VQRPHDQARLQFICRNQRLLDVLVRRRLPRGNELRAHVDAIGAERERGDQAPPIRHASRFHERDLSSSATRGSRIMLGMSSSPGWPPHSKPSTLIASHPIRSAVSE